MNLPETTDHTQVWIAIVGMGSAALEYFLH